VRLIVTIVWGKDIWIGTRTLALRNHHGDGAIAQAFGETICGKLDTKQLLDAAETLQNGERGADKQGEKLEK